MQMPTGNPILSDTDKRLGELILYVSQKCANDYFLGDTKLHKILFFSDFTAFGEWGSTITGVEYHHQDLGPMVKRMIAVTDALRRDRAFDIQPTNCGGYRQNRPVNLREPDISIFTGREIAVVDGWMERLKNLTGAQVSKMSHETAAWRLTKGYEIIDPRTAWIGWGEPSTAQIIRGHELAEKYGLLV